MHWLPALLASSLDEAALCALWLCFARVLPLCLIAPFWTVRAAPGVAVVSGVALACVLALALSPAALAAAPALSAQSTVLVPALLTELGLGLCFAFLVSLPFWALDWAGALWWRWAGLSELLDPTDGEPGPLAELARFLAVLAFFAAGGTGALVQGVGAGLASLPIGTAPALFHDPSVVQGMTRAVGQALSLALTVALPVACVTWLLEAALGALQRGFAGLPVLGFALPLRALLLLGVVLSSSALLLSRLPQVFRESLRVAARLWS